MFFNDLNGSFYHYFERFFFHHVVVAYSRRLWHYLLIHHLSLKCALFSPTRLLLLSRLFLFLRIKNIIFAGTNWIISYFLRIINLVCVKMQQKIFLLAALLAVVAIAGASNPEYDDPLSDEFIQKINEKATTWKVSILLLLKWFYFILVLCKTTWHHLGVPSQSKQM